MVFYGYDVHVPWASEPLGKLQGHCQHGGRQTLREQWPREGCHGKGEQLAAAGVSRGCSEQTTEAATPKGNLCGVGLEVPIRASERPS